MAVGKEIVSAFAGAADYLSFDIVNHVSSSETIRTNLSEKEKELNRLYSKVRQERNDTTTKKINIFEEIFKKLQKDHPTDWLLPLELYELNGSQDILEHLLNLKATYPNLGQLIDDGLELIEKNNTRS